MVQILRPVSDINTGWSTDPSGAAGRYACIDDETYSTSDPDAIYAMANVYQECKLSAPAETPASGGGALKWYGFREEITGNSITPSVRCGSTVIKTGSAVGVSDNWYALYSLSLSEAEMANITDWSNVRIRFAASRYSAQKIRICMAYLEVPDKKSSIGLEMGCSF